MADQEGPAAPASVRVPLVAHEDLAQSDEDVLEIEATELRSIADLSTADEGGGIIKRSKMGVFWRQQVHLSVPHEACRDHLALERTFLVSLRTSTALVMLGVIVAQAFRLEHDLERTRGSLYRASKGVASTLIGSAIVVQVVGAWRFWRQQNAMARGRVHAAGWELHLIALVTFLVCFILLIVVCVVPAD